jgi:hypothetical protein
LNLEGEIGCSVPVNSLDEYSKTTLHQAAETHSVQCIDLLLLKQARTDIKSKGGQIHLDVALHCKRLQVHWSLYSGTGDLLRLIEDKNIAPSSTSRNDVVQAEEHDQVNEDLMEEDDGTNQVNDPME